MPGPRRELPIHVVGAATLERETGEAARGARDLATGAQSLQKGVDTLVQGNLKLKAALGTVTGKLPADEDLDRLRKGANTLAARSGELTKGLRDLADGAERVASGAGSLRQGAASPQDGLARRYSQVPARVEQLGGDPEGLAASVTVTEQAASPVENNGAAFAPYLMALVLWVGGTLTTFIFPHLLLPESGRGPSRLARVLRKFSVPAGFVAL